jgi:uracil-DNA glycosylase
VQGIFFHKGVVMGSLDFLAPGWHSFLSNEFEKSYIEGLRNLLRGENQSHHRVFPPKDNIFRALKLVDYWDVKVVILGQDPYHGQGQANGLAFAVEPGIPKPPSLVNIFKEIGDDLGQGEPTCSSLEGWAQQGVLLLNTVLTVRESSPFSHRDKGWETFTDKVISVLNSKQTPVIFLLWGAAAQAKTKLIENPLHKILTAPHPSPLSAHRGFLGCKHFSKSNHILKQAHLPPIEWIKSFPLKSLEPL